MDSWTIINIFLNLITILNSLSAAIVSLATIIILIIYHHRSRSVPLLIAGYTSLAILLSAIMLGSMGIASLCGFLGIHLEEHGNTPWCLWRGYLVHGFCCALYDAYGLQAIFRFFRIVFHRRKILHNFYLYRIIIPIEMTTAVIFISPVLIWKIVTYLPSEFYCQTPFVDLPAILYVAGRLYGFPLGILFGTYWYLLRYVRRTTPLADTDDARRRVRNNARDVIVIRKLLITIIILVFLGLPSIIFLILFICTGNLLAITYRIGWCSVSFSLVFLIMTLIKYTIPLRDTIKKLINNVGFVQRRIGPQPTVRTRIATN